MQFIAFGKPGKQEDIPNIEKKKKPMENPKKKILVVCDLSQNRIYSVPALSFLFFFLCLLFSLLWSL
jgi:hypothetical protein